MIPPCASREPLVSTAVVLRVLVLSKRVCAWRHATTNMRPRTWDAGLTPLAWVVCKQLTSGITRIGPAPNPDSRPHGDVANAARAVQARSNEAGHGHAEVNSINLVRHSPAHLGAPSAAVPHPPHPGIGALQEQRSTATAAAPRRAPAAAAGAGAGAETFGGQQRVARKVDDEAWAPRGCQGRQTQTRAEGAGGSFFNADFNGGLGRGIRACADGGYQASIRCFGQEHRSQVMTTVHMAARAHDVLLVRVPLL